MIIKQLVGLVMVMTLAYTPTAGAHGEKSQEPFLRMRTIMWYDVQWSTERVKVNEEMTLTGKFHVFEDWPVSVLPPPSQAYVNVSVPGPQLIRKATYINGVPVVNTANLEIGRDYEFKIVLQGRTPGSYHLHPMVNIETGGPTVGPGKWVTVEGDADAFSNPVTTLTGETIDLETYGRGRVIGWHLLWIALAVGWLGFWVLPRPFLGRLLLVEGGTPEDELVSPRDRRVGWAFLVVTLLLVAVGYFTTNATYPETVPLQSGRTDIRPLEKPPQVVEAQVERATYTIPTRTFAMNLKVTNKGDTPIRLGEMATANVRFLNPAVPPETRKPEHRAVWELDRSTLAVEPQGPINPGESKTLRVTAADAVWETERMTMLYDPENRFAALLMFFDTEGGRRIIAVSAGSLIPQFKET